jgi:hypothetical protein
VGVEYHKAGGEYYPLRLIWMLITPKWHGMWPLGDLVMRGFFKTTVGMPWVSTKEEEIKEWETPKSKSTVVKKD